MYRLKDNDLLIVTKQQFEDVRKEYGINDESIERDVNALIAWYKLQPHLPQIELDRDWLERLLVVNKCSVEKAKHKLDWKFASRNLLPEFYGNRNAAASIAIAENSIFITFLPKLSEDNTRVGLISFRSPDPNHFDIEEYYKLVFTILEYRQHHDYCMGDRLIFDLRYLSLGHYLKFYPSVAKQAATANKNVVGTRVASVHLINPTAVVSKVVLLARAILPDKLFRRIHIHQSPDELYNYISREILPKDLGGDGESYDSLYANASKYFKSEDFCKWIEMQDQLRSDESKRLADGPYDEMLGIPGSFRTLSVD